MKENKTMESKPDIKQQGIDYATDQATPVVGKPPSLLADD
jgi:hypothetical protein